MFPILLKYPKLFIDFQLSRKQIEHIKPYMYAWINSHQKFNQYGTQSLSQAEKTIG